MKKLVMLSMVAMFALVGCNRGGHTQKQEDQGSQKQTDQSNTVPGSSGTGMQQSDSSTKGNNQ